ncbi:MAG: archaeal proteasome endopeptidase complex subunit alpha [Candidatus Micrarchaeia archaeon]
MYPTSPSAYDRAITVFSPDGRLFQVEYAKEAVNRGATSMALAGKDGVVFIAHKTKISKLFVPESLKKIFIIDEHMAIVASGLIADARRLIDTARIEAQRYRYTYNEPADVEYITREIADMMQAYTQYGGARPFGASLIFAGVDSEPRVFETEPSGSYTGMKAAVIGAGRNEVSEFFEKEYDEKMNIEELILFGFKALKKIPDMKLKSEIFDVGIVPLSTKKFEFLSPEKVSSYVSKV